MDNLPTITDTWQHPHSGEGLLVLPVKPVMLTLGARDTINQKIESLKKQGASLTDHTAIAAKQTTIGRYFLWEEFLPQRIIAEINDYPKEPPAE